MCSVYENWPVGIEVAEGLRRRVIVKSNRGVGVCSHDCRGFDQARVRCAGALLVLGAGGEPEGPVDRQDHVRIGMLGPGGLLGLALP